MFGVFSLYEQQLLHDWIAGTWERPGTGALSRNGVFRSRHRQPHLNRAVGIYGCNITVTTRSNGKWNILSTN